VKDVCLKCASELMEHYNELAEKHGDSPRGAQWTDLATQVARFQVLMDIGDLSGAKVLDFGCGAGRLYDVLSECGFDGEYVGMDVAEAALNLARVRHPGVRFELRNVLEDGLDETFDYVFVSGMFNNKIDDNWQYFSEIIRLVFEKTRVGLAFNMMSKYVDWEEDDLWYVQPEDVFRFCKKELSSRVTLRNDYLVKANSIPFEFAVYIYKS